MLPGTSSLRVSLSHVNQSYQGWSRRKRLETIYRVLFTRPPVVASLMLAFSNSGWASPQHHFVVAEHHPVTILRTLSRQTEIVRFSPSLITNFSTRSFCPFAGPLPNGNDSSCGKEVQEGMAVSAFPTPRHRCCPARLRQASQCETISRCPMQERASSAKDPSAFFLLI